jgi:hypothetical protein
VIVLSVDSTATGAQFAHKLQLPFTIVSDVDMDVINAYKLPNPDNEDLPLHSIYILGRDRKVLYRKVANRRPLTAELLSVLDYVSGKPVPAAVRGKKPSEGAGKRERMARNFAYWEKAALAAGKTTKLPAGLLPAHKAGAQKVITGFDKGSLELAMMAWRPLAPAVAKAHGAQVAQQLRSYVLREGFLKGKTYQLDLLQRIATARPGSPGYKAATKEFLGLTGAKWGPLDAMFDAQHALDYILEK